MSNPTHAVRERGFADFSTTQPEIIAGQRHWLTRGQNFLLEWVELSAVAASFSVASDDEMMVIAPSGSLRIRAAGSELPAVDAPAHSVCILAPGHYSMSGEASAKCAVFASQRSDIGTRRMLGAHAYETPDPKIPTPARLYRRKHRSGPIQVLDIGAVMASKDKPRLKILQSETLSINIVEYEGPRNRAELSPHSHDSFEQGSLAMAGDFVHHLRVSWGNDANQWREDEHLHAPSPSLAVASAGMIHTSEGVGPGHHFLLDLFCPPRADFIRNGWVANSADYEELGA